MSIKNRELSQFGSFIVINDSTQDISITSDSTPKIGIGTLSPQYKLDVNGDINFSGDLYRDGVLFSQSPTQWVSVTSGIHTSSNVGVGTTNPTFKLDVGGDINFTGNLYQNGILLNIGDPPFPEGDYGILTSPILDSFEVCISNCIDQIFDCLIQPSGSLSSIDLEVL